MSAAARVGRKGGAVNECKTCGFAEDGDWTYHHCEPNERGHGLRFGDWRPTGMGDRGMNRRRLLSAQEVAFRLRVSVEHAYRIIRSEIRHMRLGKVIRVSEDALTEYENRATILPPCRASSTGAQTPALGTAGSTTKTAAESATAPSAQIEKPLSSSSEGSKRRPKAKVYRMTFPRTRSKK